MAVPKRLMPDVTETRASYPVELKNNNIKYWLVRLSGPPGSPYAGYQLVLGIQFPDNYPSTCPTLKFETPVYHPQVSAETYEVDQSVYKQEWRDDSSPKNRKSYPVIEKVLAMLVNPGPVDREQASALMKTNPAAFRSRVVEVMGRPR